MIHSTLHFFRTIVIRIIKTLLKVIPKKRTLILFTAWFGKKYSDNSMYVFEYMLKFHKEYNCYWYATDKQLYKSLKENGIPVVYSKSIKAKWYQIRASVLLSSVQLSEYNPYFLSKVIYIDLGHGHSIKDPGSIVSSPKLIKFNLLLKKGIDYYTITCSDHMPYQQKDYSNILGNNTVVPLGFARNDVFFDNELRKNKNDSIASIIRGKTVISYLPTHRSDGKEIMDVKTLLDLEQIDAICKRFNAVFLIKKHFYHRNEKSDVESYENIFDITNDLSIDTQVLLSETSILISDYSACFIDYLLLDRPIVLYQYDYDDFIQKERQLLIPFNRIKISSYPKSPKELSSELLKILENHLEDGRSLDRQSVKREYFVDSISTHVRQDVANFIIKKIQKI